MEEEKRAQALIGTRQIEAIEDLVEALEQHKPSYSQAQVDALIGRRQGWSPLLAFGVGVLVGFVGAVLGYWAQYMLAMG